jgi:hypothetical protein
MIEVMSRMERKNEHSIYSRDNGSRGMKAELFRESVGVSHPHSQGRFNLLKEKGHHKVV